MELLKYKRDNRVLVVPRRKKCPSISRSNLPRPHRQNWLLPSGGPVLRHCLHRFTDGIAACGFRRIADDVGELMQPAISFAPAPVKKSERHSWQSRPASSTGSGRWDRCVSVERNDDHATRPPIRASAIEGERRITSHHPARFHRRQFDGMNRASRQ